MEGGEGPWKETANFCACSPLFLGGASMLTQNGVSLSAKTILATVTFGLLDGTVLLLSPF